MIKGTGTINLEKKDIYKEGWLNYQSKYSKRFRKVYAVCSRNNFYIFEKDLYLDPIEIIEIKKIKTVKSDNDFGNLCFVSYNLKMIIFFKF